MSDVLSVVPDDHAELQAAFANSRCLVTGGAGVIGSNLTRALLASGARVTILDNFSTGRPEHLPQSDRLEIVRAGYLPRRTGRPSDRIGGLHLHLAAQVDTVKWVATPVDAATTNVVGTIRLLDACRGKAINRLVYSSSSASFGEADVLPIDENHAVRPVSFHALSKLPANDTRVLPSACWTSPRYASATSTSTACRWS